MATLQKILPSKERERTFTKTRYAKQSFLRVITRTRYADYFNNIECLTDELDIGRDRSLSFVDTNERVKDRSLSYVDSDERASKLSERMRDLYDFKTENEWPKRAGTSRENTWISKSSSEEERSNYLPIRRNSQDLEFNDRIDIFKVSMLNLFRINSKI